MTRKIAQELELMSTDQLVDRFAEIALQQDEALLRDDVSEVNRLFELLMMISQLLKTRAGDQRRALLRLYKHPNMQVRVKAAKATLAVARVAARQTLEEIKTANWHPQSLEAGMSLWNLDRGVFKPT